jgi:hypothetical protein
VGILLENIFQSQTSNTIYLIMSKNEKQKGDPRCTRFSYKLLRRSRLRIRLLVFSEDRFLLGKVTLNAKALWDAANGIADGLTLYSTVLA